MIKFRKPYQRMQEGMLGNGIVMYDKHGCWRSEKLPIESYRDFGKTMATKYQHTLIIDLWLCILRFSWITTTKKEQGK